MFWHALRQAADHEACALPAGVKAALAFWHMVLVAIPTGGLGSCRTPGHSQACRHAMPVESLHNHPDMLDSS